MMPRFNPDRGTCAWVGQPFPYAWNPDHAARVGLLPREGRNADIIWCDVDPCYVFHPCNAYETDDGQVIVDVVAHDSMFASSRQGPDSDKVGFERWTIDPHPQEFPRHADCAEGDGWLMGLVVNMADESTDLVILNAADFTGPAQAVVTIPHRVPPGFHGNWVAAL